MPGIFQFGEVTFTLSDLLICRFNIVTDANEGPVVSLPDGQMFSSEPEADTDKQRGYGKYTRGLAVPVGSKCKIKAAGAPTAAMYVLANVNSNTSGTTPSRVRRTTTPAGGRGLPYWSALAVSPSDDGGVVVYGLRANKLDTVPTHTADGETNKFNIWETEGYSFPFNGILDYKETYESEADWTAPTNAAEMSEWFERVATEALP